MSIPKLPPAPQSIEKGVPLKELLGKTAVDQMATNFKIAYADFPVATFKKDVMQGLDELSLKARANHIATLMRLHLPSNYTAAIEVILQSLTPANIETKDLGLNGMFYMPHAAFIEMYGLDTDYNGGIDPFNVSMKAQYELTKRFTAEFSIRPFISTQAERTFEVLYKWMRDPDPHVRRLCSEGPRPRLPWASKLRDLAKDPSPSLPILDALKDDESLYVRRSVANHIGDIAKDNLKLALEICEGCLDGASKERKWVIRHALRHPAKKEHPEALRIRKLAK